MSLINYTLNGITSLFCFIISPIGYKFKTKVYICTRKGIDMLSEFLKAKRKAFKFTQEDLAVKAGVGLRVVREMEQGKRTLRMDKVNQVLALFGAELGVVPKVKRDE